MRALKNSMLIKCLWLEA